MSTAGQWDFTIKNGQLLMSLNTSGGNFEPREESFMQPSLHLIRSAIMLFESGNYKFSLNFNNIGDIDGDTPTDIQDAYDKITTLIANFNLGGATPSLFQVLGVSDRPVNLLEGESGAYTFQASDAQKYVVQTQEFDLNLVADVIAENGMILVKNLSGSSREILADTGVTLVGMSAIIPDKGLAIIKQTELNTFDITIVSAGSGNLQSVTDGSGNNETTNPLIIKDLSDPTNKYIEIKGDVINIYDLSLSVFPIGMYSKDGFIIADSGTTTRGLFDVFSGYTVEDGAKAFSYGLDFQAILDKSTSRLFAFQYPSIIDNNYTIAWRNRGGNPAFTDELPTGKIFRCNLTQSGTDSSQFINSGSVTLGVSYQININTGSDFTVVGAPNNDVGTRFIAINSDTPTWGSGELTYNTANPIAESNFVNQIGAIGFKFTIDGEYQLRSDDGLFVDGTIVILNNNIIPVNGSISAVLVDSNAININSYNALGVAIPGLLNRSSLMVIVP